MYAHQWGSERELEDVRRYLMEVHGDIFTGEIFGRRSMEGVEKEKTLPPNVWLFSLRDLPYSTIYPPDRVVRKPSYRQT